MASDETNDIAGLRVQIMGTYSNWTLLCHANADRVHFADNVQVAFPFCYKGFCPIAEINFNIVVCAVMDDKSATEYVAEVL